MRVSLPSLVHNSLRSRGSKFDGCVVCLSEARKRFHHVNGTARILNQTGQMTPRSKALFMLYMLICTGLDAVVCSRYAASLFSRNILHLHETQFGLPHCHATEARNRRQGIERTLHGRQKPTLTASNGAGIATGRAFETSAAFAPSTRNFAQA